MALTFVEKCLEGDVDPEAIDDFVAAWHQGAGQGLQLHEFLGMDDTEYALWVANPKALHPILAARRFKLPLRTAVIDAREMALAARAISAEEAADIVAWLKRTGRL